MAQAMSRDRSRTIRFALATTAVALLAGCQLGGAGGGTGPAATTATGDARSTRIVTRDVEAPSVFNVTAEALWDGRPSLGGVWVASDKATDPERVILRNPANGKFVIGALFRREAFNPGPPLQISSDAAAALGMMAGAPATVSVTALRREEVPVEGPDATAPIVDANEGIKTTALPAAAGAAARPAATAPAPAIPTPPRQPWPSPLSPPKTPPPPVSMTTSTPSCACSTTTTTQPGVPAAPCRSKRQTRSANMAVSSWNGTLAGFAARATPKRLATASSPQSPARAGASLGIKR